MKYFTGSVRVAFVWVVLLATLASNALANILPFNNITTGEVSENYPTLFTPANYVFSIWSVIYIGLFVFAIVQSRREARADVQFDRLGALFVLGNIANSFWLLAWHYDYILVTPLLMLVLLVSLILMHRVAYGQKATRLQTWGVRVPVSIYLGWISVATIANMAVWFTSLGWYGQPLAEWIWTVAMCVIAAGLGVFMAVKKKDYIYPLVITWALIGIFVKQFLS